MCEICSKLLIKTTEDVIDVNLVFLLLTFNTFNRFHILFWCFHCWLLTIKCQVARPSFLTHATVFLDKGIWISLEPDRKESQLSHKLHNSYAMSIRKNSIHVHHSVSSSGKKLQSFFAQYFRTKSLLRDLTG